MFNYNSYDRHTSIKCSDGTKMTFTHPTRRNNYNYSSKCSIPFKYKY